MMMRLENLNVETRFFFLKKCLISEVKNIRSFLKSFSFQVVFLDDSSECSGAAGGCCICT